MALGGNFHVRNIPGSLCGQGGTLSMDVGVSKAALPTFGPEGMLSPGMVAWEPGSVLLADGFSGVESSIFHFSFSGRHNFKNTSLLML